MSKADARPTATTSRRAVLGGAAVAVLAPGTAVAADPLVALEQDYLAADRAWLAANNAYVDASDAVSFGKAAGPVPAGLREAAEATSDRLEGLRAELAARPATTLEGVAVKVRRLVEAEAFGTAGDEIDFIKSVLEYLTVATGREQFAGFRQGVAEELVRFGRSV